LKEKAFYSKKATFGRRNSVWDFAAVAQKIYDTACDSKTGCLRRKDPFLHQKRTFKQICIAKNETSTDKMMSAPE